MTNVSCPAAATPLRSAVPRTAPSAFLRRRSKHSDPSFPNHSIRLIVPYTPGGPTDVMGRLMSQSLSASLRPAGLCRQPPWRGFDAWRQIRCRGRSRRLYLARRHRRDSRYRTDALSGCRIDPKVFVPVAAFATVPFIMIAGPKAPGPAHGRRDRLRQSASRQAHDRCTERRAATYAGGMVQNLTGTDIVIVTYNGASGDLTDLIGGQIDLAIETSSVVLAASRRRLVARACNRLGGTASRNAERADHDRKRRAWFCREFLDRPCRAAGTPQAVVDKLNAAINAGLRTADCRPS